MYTLPCPIAEVASPISSCDFRNNVPEHSPLAPIVWIITINKISIMIQMQPNPEEQ